MGVETQTFDGVKVALKRHEAIEGRPQAVAVNRQYHTHQLAVFAQGIDLGDVRATLDASFVFGRRNVGRHRRVRSCPVHVVLHGIFNTNLGRLHKLAFIEINQANIEALEHLFDLLGGGAGFQHAGSRQDVGFDVQVLVLNLRRAQHYGGGRNHNREHNTQYQRNHQGSGDGIFSFSHEQASV